MMGAYQVDQVGHPLRGVYAHVVLVDRDTKLLEHLFTLPLNLLRVLHLLLSRLVETLHELLACLQLVLQLCLHNGLNGTVFGLVRNFLL